MDATRQEEDRIMRPVLARLNRAADALAKEVAQAHVSGRDVAALSRKQTALIGVMREAARLAVAQTDGLSAADVKPALAWRTDKVKAIVKIIKASDTPSLGVLMSLPQQARGMAADLTRHVSDTLVGQLTAQRQAECGPGEVLIWQPERDACVRCLRYAGLYRASADQFPAGLSFDPHAPKPDPKKMLAGPPLHGDCRCELVVIPRHVAVDNAAALVREAQRSILKGWALDSEGDAVRTRAAQALLDSGVMAPKSVLAETRKRLRSGEPFTRDVP